MRAAPFLKAFLPTVVDIMAIWINTLATWCEELTHWKRPWCWERVRAREEGGDRGRDGWMASLTHWIWVWVNSGRQGRTGKPGLLQSMGSQRVGHDWATEEQQREELISLCFFNYRGLTPSPNIYVKLQPQRSCRGWFCASSRIPANRKNTLMVSLSKQSWIPADTSITCPLVRGDNKVCSRHGGLSPESSVTT